MSSSVQLTRQVINEFGTETSDVLPMLFGGTTFEPGPPHSIEGLGSSNSVFKWNSLNVFGVCWSSDGAKVKRFMMSAWVRSGSCSRWGSTIASRFSCGSLSNLESITRTRIDAEL